ncbi:MAG TPA: 2OG-Fe(II) oxygenase [Dyella sp.]|nr:2OG-Fe(II) oxygenase [Dyella sp.]
MSPLSSRFEAAADALATKGWCVLPQLLPEAVTAALASECASMHAARRMTPARVGVEHGANPLRGDHTRWFEMDSLSMAQQPFMEAIDVLQRTLNQSLMLGLHEELEAHYTVFVPGTRYARHLDRLRHSDARVVSAVYYLNDAWDPADGGALRLYLDDGRTQDVLPQGGTLVLFMSDRFEHEVLPATRERMSIACWLRRRESGALPA